MDGRHGASRHPSLGLAVVGFLALLSIWKVVPEGGGRTLEEVGSARSWRTRSPPQAACEDGVMADTAPRGTDELLAASRGLLGVVVRSLAPALEDVTVPQFRLIVLVSTLGPTRAGDLAERLAVGPSTLTRNVDRLVAGGWVERRSSEENRREVLVVATDRGRELVDEVSERRRQELAAILARIPEGDRDAVVAGMGALRRAMGEPLPEEISAFGG
ncbi:DNA-binding transcriptional regulator, MarR family [Curtobacterium sp. 9128]|nr:DNA-binding transcriptional regulator, MarR family [Curtobacterium sp. 9128]